MKVVELYGRVRYAVQIEGMSRREAARQFGIDPRTVAKMLAFSVPPGYPRRQRAARPKPDPFTGIFDGIHAQADCGEALAEIAGVERKIHFFAIDLPHSDACFVQAYPAETTEAFCDGHNAAFAFFRKVPRSILYDNTPLAVARILGDGVRQ